MKTQYADSHTSQLNIYVVDVQIDEGDPPYTSWEPEGESIPVDTILADVAAFETRHVVVTGGEPMIDPDIVELTHGLREAGYHTTIETAATVWKEVVCDLASISPKLGNSTPWQRDGGRRADAHERIRINLVTIRRFMELSEYQLKFVVDTPEDISEIDALLGQIGSYDPSQVLLMPQGVTADGLMEKSRWIADLCKERGFRFCPRLHIMLYGNARGT